MSDFTTFRLMVQCFTQECIYLHTTFYTPKKWNMFSFNNTPSDLLEDKGLHELSCYITNWMATFVPNYYSEKGKDTFETVTGREESMEGVFIDLTAYELHAYRFMTINSWLKAIPSVRAGIRSFFSLVNISSRYHYMCGLRKGYAYAILYLYPEIYEMTNDNAIEHFEALLGFNIAHIASLIVDRKEDLTITMPELVSKTDNIDILYTKKWKTAAKDLLALDKAIGFYMDEHQELEHIKPELINYKLWSIIFKAKWSASNVAILYYAITKGFISRNTITLTVKELYAKIIAYYANKGVVVDPILVQVGAFETINYATTTPHKTDTNIDKAIFNKELNDIKVSLCEVNDMRQLIMGHLTNCCQSIGWAGSDCCENSWTNKNAGTIIFEHDNKIIAQCYIVQSLNAKTLVIDNVEIKSDYRDTAVDTIKQLILDIANTSNYDKVYVGKDYSKVDFNDFTSITTKVTEDFDFSCFDYSDAMSEYDDTSWEWDAWCIKYTEQIIRRRNN